MNTQNPAEATKAQKLWDDLAVNWQKYAEQIYQPRFELHRQMGRLAKLQANDNYADFATGMGEPLLSIQKDNPLCHGYGFDSSPVMLKIAAERARQQNVRGLTFCESNGQKFEYPDGFFSAFFCCFGFEYVPDVPPLLTEINRCLRPGSHLVVNVWGPENQNPVQTVASQTLRDLGLTPAAIDLFRFSKPDVLKDFLAASGFTTESVTDFNGQLQTPDFDSYWNMQKETSPLIFKSVTDASPGDVARVRAATLKNCQPYLDGAGQLTLPFLTRIFVARKL